MALAKTLSTARKDRKSTRLNSIHLVISYAVFCLKKKNAPRNGRDLAQVFDRALVRLDDAETESVAAAELVIEGCLESTVVPADEVTGFDPSIGLGFGLVVGRFREVTEGLGGEPARIAPHARRLHLHALDHREASSERVELRRGYGLDRDKEVGLHPRLRVLRFYLVRRHRERR